MARKAAVVGVDNNMQGTSSADHGDTTPTLRRLQAETRRFEHHEFDVRDRAAMRELVERVRPALVLLAAAHPSRDVAARRPFETSTETP